LSERQSFSAQRIGEEGVALRGGSGLLFTLKIDIRARMAGDVTAESKEMLFASTSWTLILKAGGSQSKGEANRALTQLCTIYWRPIYLFLRRRGYELPDAQDLTQGFFAELIESRFYLRADPEKGRFRSFLLGALKHYLANRKDYENAQKRGHGISFVPLGNVEEEDLSGAVAHSYRIDAEESYEREWAATLLRRVINILEEECQVAGKRTLFHALKGHLAAEGAHAIKYEELSKQLSRSVVSLRKDVSRFRERYRAILRREIRQTVADENEIDAELQYLRAVMAR
jgi:DNA-directed RNA polymerase specialized sigma24 family protein